MKCPMCISGLPKSCLTGTCKDEDVPINRSSNQDTNYVDEEVSSRTSAREPGTRFRSNKRDASLKDQQSTGRKRAAKLYPLYRESPCEWQGKSNCGGGNFPILGCISGLQEARHHGPDKSVSNNETGNVHRICHACHNRWHNTNNSHYDWNSTTTNEHHPKDMTPEQREQAAVVYAIAMTNREKRIRD